MEDNKGNAVQNPAGPQKGPQCWHGCRCGACQSHRILRWVLGLVILLIVFWLGTVAGSMHHGFARRSFNGRQAYPVTQPYNSGGAPRMMGAGSGSSTPTTTPKTTTGAQ